MLELQSFALLTMSIMRSTHQLWIIFLLPNCLIIKSRTPCRHSIPHLATVCLLADLVPLSWLTLLIFHRRAGGTLLSYDLFCRILVGSPWGTQFCISVWINASRLFSEHNVVHCRGPRRNCCSLFVPSLFCCLYKMNTTGAKCSWNNSQKIQNSPMRGWCHPPADDLFFCVCFSSIQHTPSLWTDVYTHRYYNMDGRGRWADWRKHSAWHLLLLKK